jgi:hypothetical protein
MRKLPKYLGEKDGKKAIIKISDEVQPLLPKKEYYDENGNALSHDEIDVKWDAKHKETITYRLKQAAREYEDRLEKVTPLQLLEAAYKKLNHENMNMSAILLADQDKARKLAVKIQKRAHEIEGEIYRFKKAQKELRKKHGH